MAGKTGKTDKADKMDKMGFAVIGCGRIGIVHANNLANMPELELRWVYDPMAEAATKLGAELQVPVAKDLDEIYNDPAVQGVIICAPVAFHVEISKKATDAGKKVLCEKPLAPCLADCLEVMEYVKQKGGLLMVGFNRPYDPGFYNLRHQVADGAVGKVEHVSITSRDPAPPSLDYLKVSGGIFRDMMIHDFEMALRLLNSPAKSIAVMASSIVDPEIGKIGDLSSALVSIFAADGSTCSIHNSRRASYGYDQRVEVFGSAGMVQANNFHEDNLVLATKDGYRQRPLQNFFLERYTDSYKNIVRTFVAAIQDDKKALEECRTTNGINAIYLAEQAEIAKGKRQDS